VCKLIALLTVVVPAAIAAVAPGLIIAHLGAAAHTDGGEPVPDWVPWVGAYIAMTIIAFALTVLLRNVVAPIAVLTLIPLLAWTGVFQLPQIIRLLPHDASLSALRSAASEATQLPVTGATTALLGWCVISTGISALTFARRDS
jgi:hypothetical protein